MISILSINSKWKTTKGQIKVKTHSKHPSTEVYTEFPSLCRQSKEEDDLEDDELPLVPQNFRKRNKPDDSAHIFAARAAAKRARFEARWIHLRWYWNYWFTDRVIKYWWPRRLFSHWRPLRGPTLEEGMLYFARRNGPFLLCQSSACNSSQM